MPISALSFSVLLNLSCQARVFNSKSDVRAHKIQAQTVETEPTLINLGSQSLDDISLRTKEFYRKSSPNITDADFIFKWDYALDSGDLKFLRSFVGAYYLDLMNVKGAGPLGICFGDAHLENFGFVVFSDGPKFVYNDFDDSGYCPVGLDVLRYLTSLRLYEKKSSDFPDKVIKEYVEVLSGRRLPRKLDSSISFEPEKKRSKNIRNLIDGQKFAVSDEFAFVSASTTKKIKEVFATDVNLKKFKINDIVSTKKEGGGSAGLEKYLIYVVGTGDTNNEILEFKPVITPGTAAGNWKSMLENRVEFLIKEFWENSVPLNFYSVKMENTNYILRSRTKGSVDLGSLNSDERLNLYKAQVGIIAKQHKKFWSESRDMKEWLSENSTFLSERYAKILKHVSAKNSKN